MKLTDIIPDFSTMSSAEIEETIRGVRRSRTTVKAVSVTKRPTKTAAKEKKAVASELSNVSLEQLEMLKKLFS